MDKIKKSYLQLHIAVLLWGFTAIFGEIIALPAIVLVWWRVLFTLLGLLYFINFGKTILTLNKNKLLTFSFIGIIIALHWMCFYGSIKLSNASIGLICLSTTSLFTAIIEPLIMKKKWVILELVIGASVIPGMYLIVDAVDIKYHFGIYIGILSALFAAIFSSLNKKNIQETDPYTLSFIELLSAIIFMTFIIVIMIITENPPKLLIPVSNFDFLNIVIMALFCTVLPLILSLKALRNLSTFASNLVINLEPVYGILLAIVLLNQHKDLNIKFYIGTTIIVLTVLSYPYIHNKRKVNQPL